MPYPNFAGKHEHEAFFTPQDFLAYARRTQQLPELSMPEGVIFCYHNGLLRKITEQEDTEQIAAFRSIRILRNSGGKAGICGGFGIGAPAVTTLCEELIALGNRKFISIGAAGTLQPHVQIGDLVVCDRAVRDEGVSHHYMAPDTYAYPTSALTAQLEQHLREMGHTITIGPSWTIDAPYRETVAEARHYQQEGVITVEMEAAALFAVAQYRGVEIAAAFVISDSLADMVWNPRFESEKVEKGLWTLFTAARDTLTGT
jgi:uridine phosphorylase